MEKPQAEQRLILFEDAQTESTLNATLVNVLTREGGVWQKFVDHEPTVVSRIRAVNNIFQLFDCEGFQLPVPVSGVELRTADKRQIRYYAANSMIVRQSPQNFDDDVNHPQHYTVHPSGVECIEITRHMNFNLGNVLKYVWRAGLKEDAIKDLKKAQFYLADEIARRENGHA